MTVRVLSAAAVVAALCIASPALACKGKNVLFEDNFSDDSNWPQAEGISVEGGALKIVATAPYVNRALYQGDTYQKADICVDVAQETSIDTGGGMIFAATDYGTYYYFWVNPTGYAGVSKLNNHRWLQPVPIRQVKLSGPKTTLRLTLDGNRATAYVNDQKFATFRVTQPEGGGFIGMEGDSTDKDTVTWSFSGLKVTDLP